MKKLLLSLATVALAGAFAMADSYTLEFAGTGTSSDSGTAISSSTAVADILTSGSSYVSSIAAADKVYLGKNTEGLKFSSAKANGSLTLTLSTDGKVDATSIVVNAKKYGSDAAAVSVNGADAKTVTAESADYTFAVTGELTQIKIDATKRLYVSSITVNYTAGSSDLQAAGLSFPEGTYTVNLGEEFTAPALTKATDAAATYTSSNEEVATVDAATGAVTVLAAGTTVIKATTPATATYKAGEASYTLNVVSAYGSIADFYTVGEGNSGIINFPLVVAYQNGTSTYAYDLAGNYTLIYGTNVGTRERGDIIPAGWEGKYSPYNGLPEIAPVSAPAESVDNVDYTPAEVESITDDMINYVVVLKKVTFAEDTPSTKSNFEGTTEDGTTYTFRNNFTIETAVAGTYNVELAVSTYYNNMQLYPIKYTTWESGVNEITVAEGEAEYYNMQGVRVANPENGMFIRIQNGKAQKVVIK